tara:strand:- start:4328 stop:4564 length:237 start_codon:yes stop_codon:yes gene_type:complete
MPIDITHLYKKAHVYLLITLYYLEKKRNNMSITHIKTNKKIEVLLRLLKENESLQDASSKAGLNIEKTKLIMNKNSNF